MNNKQKSLNNLKGIQILKIKEHYIFYQRDLIKQYLKKAIFLIIKVYLEQEKLLNKLVLLRN